MKFNPSPAKILIALTALAIPTLTTPSHASPPRPIAGPSRLQLLPDAAAWSQLKQGSGLKTGTPIPFTAQFKLPDWTPGKGSGPVSPGAAPHPCKQFEVVLVPSSGLITSPTQAKANPKDENYANSAYSSGSIRWAASCENYFPGQTLTMPFTFKPTGSPNFGSSVRAELRISGSGASQGFAAIYMAIDPQGRLSLTPCEGTFSNQRDLMVSSRDFLRSQRLANPKKALPADLTQVPAESLEVKP